jgi:hypothetical protein
VACQHSPNERPNLRLVINDQHGQIRHANNLSGKSCRLTNHYCCKQILARIYRKFSTIFVPIGYPQLRAGEGLEHGTLELYAKQTPIYTYSSTPCTIRNQSEDCESEAFVLIPLLALVAWNGRFGPGWDITILKKLIGGPFSR